MQAKDFYCEVGEVRIVTQNWAAECERRGTTLDSSTWAWSGGGTISLPTTSGVVSMVTLDPLSSGTLKCIGTFGNGEVICAWREVKVTEVIAAGVPEDVVYLIAAENDDPIEQE